MKITRKFTKAGQDVFSTTEWTIRSSKITNPDGTVVFRMDDAEVPAGWSQLATDIMVSKYFRKAGVPVDGGPNGIPTPGVEKSAGGAPVPPKFGPEKSVKQVVHRLAGCWRHWGETHGYFDTKEDAQAFYDELAYMLIHQVAAPNSPQWFNTGLHWAYGINGPAQGHWIADPETGEATLAPDAYSHPQPHACFIQSVSDDLVNEGGIMDLWVREARLFKYGSGTGTNFSTLRADGEKLAGGGKSSGLMSWLRIGDRAASAIKSGGTTRRAAKMVCLDMDHPDIGEFVNWKVREEIKVAALVEGYKLLRKHNADLRSAGEKMKLELDYDFNGEAYATVSGQNSNNSVRIPDAFFEAVDAGADWSTTWRTSGKVARTYKARQLWDDIAYAAWRCADPGVQFDTTINAWHTCPDAGRINASNPCVTGDTLVATTAGLRRIRDLVGQRVEVIAADGRASTVERVFQSGTKPVYTLRTRSGYSLRLTGDHRVWTLNRGDVPAAELTRDDVVQLRGHGFGLEFVPTELGELLGAALGDGCITHQPSQDFLFVSLGVGEGAVADRLRAHVDWCKSWLSDGDGRGTRPSAVTATQTGLRVGTSVRAVIDRLSDLAVLDRGSHEKILRDSALVLDRPSVAAILRGLFTTDGSVADYGEKSQYVALDSTSLGLLRQVQQLLLGFGIKAKLYENRRALGHATALMPDGKGGVQSYPVRQVHSLRISKASRVAFEREIGFMPGSAKADRLAAMNTRVEAYAEPLVDRVNRLDPAGIEDVFDLTEPRTRHFVGGGVVVHNCSEYMFLDNTACNLASINLITLYDSKARRFDAAKYEHAIDLWTIVLEISVLMAAFPSRQIAHLSWAYRTLGLGYANLGALLMQAGLAYDSEEARALAGCFSAILTGRSYRQSALLAKEHGPFAGYDGREDLRANKPHMLRVVRNHRRAARGLSRNSADWESINPLTRPVPIDHGVMKSGRVLVANAPDLLDRAVVAWDEALALGEKHGYRNAQTTVIAPTGTIGLLMDCDTTGVEPDFALVKFKKLAGGGYFKIANASVKPALEALGYSAPQIKDMLVYLLGTLSVDTPVPGTGTTLRAMLAARGLGEEHLAKINDALPGVFELSFAFAPWSLGDDILARVSVDPAQAKADPGWSLLRLLGLSSSQIDALNDVICGRQTLEGAPHLKPEHLPVFDCANRCGKIGQRFIRPEGHIRMMGAVQPFISGAISKTINLPTEASVQDCKDAYRLSWELGLKANALYRDGCKLSQPLNTTVEKKDEPAPVASEAPAAAPREVVRVVERPMRRRLPDTRASITHKFNIAGHEGYLTVGLYEDGTPGELFITMAKEGSTIGGLMDAVGTATSVALQYGVPVESLVKKFTHQRFEPAGMTTNADIPFAKSLVDYIFRWMGMQFIPGYREANAPRRDSDLGPITITASASLPELVGLDPPPIEDHATRATGELFAGDQPAPAAPPPAPTLSHVHVHKTVTTTTIDVDAQGAAATPAVSALASAMASQGDGPPCAVCGTITVRNGTCHKCVNCGTSQGCS